MNLLWKKIADALITRKLRIGRNANIEVTSLNGVLTQISNAELSTLSSAARLVPLAVTTTLTAALHAGRSIIMGGAGAARTFTLPPATGTGDRYRFVVGAVNTSGYVIKVADGTDTFDGVWVTIDTDTTGAMVGFMAGANDDTITMNGTTTGGVSIGDAVELEDIALNQWALRAIVSCSGIPATPFSNTVS